MHVAVQRNWRNLPHLSSIAFRIEGFLSKSVFDLGPWLAVLFGSGIAAWFLLKAQWQWAAAIGVGLLVAIFGISLTAYRERISLLRRCLIFGGLAFAAGISVIWLRSEFVGAEAIDRPTIQLVEGYILEREDQPAQQRVRLTLAIRDADKGTARKVRVNIAEDAAIAEIGEGAIVRLRARLLPPASPMLPGAYNFARAAWFKGLSATGTALGEIEVVQPAIEGSGLARIQRNLSSHVRNRVEGSAGTIAAAFASGDRGAISEADEDAMRDAGLTHLLSISGLHLSAVIAGAYVLALKLFGLWQWLALRVRLPIMAATTGALAGIGYTLLTGAQVPTVRSCTAAILVLIALALGRQALSLRMVSVAAIFVLLLWPESISGPSFQMSFAAVLAIIALHNAAPVRAFLAPREESWTAWLLRRGGMLLLTGLVIEIALMPVVLFHFHRAGVYGALANVIAIPLVTFISMPMIALGLFLDLLGLGAPIWWVVEKSLELLLAIAHFTSGQPGAVKLLPQMTHFTFAMFILGGLWLALWNAGRRLLGFVPVSIAIVMLLQTSVPDVLISRDGRHVGVTTEDGRLISLRESRSSYAADNLIELASVTSDPIAVTNWPGAKCSAEFCTLALEGEGHIWHLLMARNRELVEERALAAACERSDIVIADRYLPSSCNPRWLKADKGLLEQTGGLALNLDAGEIVSVADFEGEHGWWRGK